VRWWPLRGRSARLGVGSASAALRRALPLTPAIPARSKCWGLNDDGRLGLGDGDNRGDGASEMGVNLPSVDLGPGWTAVEVAAGGSHTCVRLQNGAEQALKCWGRNGEGQLGLGDTTPRGKMGGQMNDSLPAVQLGTGRSAVALALGAFHSCALLDDASVKCWGWNDNGQLGLGDTQDWGAGSKEMGDSLSAVDLGPGRTVVQLAAGSRHTCVVLVDGQLYAPTHPPPLDGLLQPGLSAQRAPVIVPWRKTGCWLCLCCPASRAAPDPRDPRAQQVLGLQHRRPAWPGRHK